MGLTELSNEIENYLKRNNEPEEIDLQELKNSAETDMKMERELFNTEKEALLLSIRKSLDAIVSEDVSSYSGLFCLKREVSSGLDLSDFLDEIEFSVVCKEFFRFLLDPNIQQLSVVEGKQTDLTNVKLEILLDALIEDMKLLLLKESLFSIREACKTKEGKRKYSDFVALEFMSFDELRAYLLMSVQMLGFSEAVYEDLELYSNYFKKSLEYSCPRRIAPWFIYSLFFTYNTSNIFGDLVKDKNGEVNEITHKVFQETVLCLEAPDRRGKPNISKDKFISNAFNKYKFIYNCLTVTSPGKANAQINKSLCMFWFNELTNLYDLMLLAERGVESKNINTDNLLRNLSNIIHIKGFGTKTVIAKYLKDSLILRDIRLWDCFADIINALIQFAKTAIIDNYSMEHLSKDNDLFIYNSLVNIDYYKEFIEGKLTDFNDKLTPDEISEKEHEVRNKAYRYLYEQKFEEGRKAYRFKSY